MMKEFYEFNDLLSIMKILRSDNGCPWDKEQTHESLKNYLIEETYEVLEVLDSNEKKKLCDELGDLLLQIIFHSQIAEEENNFNINDVINSICHKMIRRHPHIFGNTKVITSSEVLQNWEEIKKIEKGIKTQTSLLKDIPSNLPSLMRSYKVQQKAAQVGFDWENPNDIFNKIYEELTELKQAQEKNDIQNINEEMGDVLFSVVNLSRFLNIHPELALTSTINKFIKRFEYIEKKSMESGKILEEMTLKEMDELWNMAKIHLQKTED